MSDAWLTSTRSSYDTDAPGYTEQVRGLLEGEPYLRASLALFAELVQEVGGGPVADVGCGPGYVTAHLHEAGVDAFGIDLSPEMVAIARRDHPELRFEVGTMTDLDLADDSVAGVVAFWSVIHVPDQAVPGVFERVPAGGAHRGLRCWSASTSATGPGTRPRATPVARSTSTAIIAGRARSRAGSATPGSRSRRSWSWRRTSAVPGALVFARAGTRR